MADSLTSFYWRSAIEGRLRAQRCQVCQLWLYPPSEGCPRCGSDDLEEAEVSTTGTVYSYTVVRQVFDPAFADALPYVVALVDLHDGPRLLANVVDARVDDVSVGLKVEMTFEAVGDKMLPQFRPC